jgi:RNA polymerase-binding transcription factor DksA
VRLTLEESLMARTTKSPAKKKATVRKAPAKKGSAKKPVARSAATKKAAARKAPARKPPAKAASKGAAKKASVKTPTKKAVAKKAPAKKTAAKKAAPAKKATAKPPTKAAAKKPPAKKAAPKKPTKSPYDKKFLDAQEEALLEERRRLTKDVEALDAEADELAMLREPGDVQFDEESGEGDTLAVERERDLALSAQFRAHIEDIDHALAKIKANTYGLCEVSGLAIPKERLRAIPWARERVEYKVGGFRR